MYIYGIYIRTVGLGIICHAIVNIHPLGICGFLDLKSLFTF